MDKFFGAVQSEFMLYIFPVAFDRLETQIQSAGDFSCAYSTAEQLEDV